MMGDANEPREFIQDNAPIISNSVNQGHLSDLQKLAIDSTIKHQASLMELMRHTDSRAQQLIAIYTGLASGAAVIS